MYRCSLCLWFAIAGYVVTMWADVTNAHHSRASRLLWGVYLGTVLLYVVLVPVATILATKVSRVDQNTALLATPDVVRVTGEVSVVVPVWTVLLLSGFLFVCTLAPVRVCACVSPPCTRTLALSRAPAHCFPRSSVCPVQVVILMGFVFSGMKMHRGYRYVSR